MPQPASRRAATNPSPPLLPGPARIRTGRSSRPLWTASAWAAAATAVPACSISVSPGVPDACALRSRPVITSPVMAPRPAASAQRSVSSSSVDACSSGSSAGQRNRLGGHGAEGTVRRPGRSRGLPRQARLRAVGSTRAPRAARPRRAPRTASRTARRSWSPIGRVERRPRRRRRRRAPGRRSGRAASGSWTGRRAPATGRQCPAARRARRRSLARRVPAPGERRAVRAARRPRPAQRRADVHQRVGPVAGPSVGHDRVGEGLHLARPAGHRPRPRRPAPAPGGRSCRPPRPGARTRSPPPPAPCTGPTPGSVISPSTVSGTRPSCSATIAFAARCRLIARRL